MYLGGVMLTFVRDMDETRVRPPSKVVFLLTTQFFSIKLEKYSEKGERRAELQPQPSSTVNTKAPWNVMARLFSRLQGDSLNHQYSTTYKKKTKQGIEYAGSIWIHTVRKNTVKADK
ncbi:hypothetical protein KIN20_011818 [Parelaphostrongylus tenuis]|uniref:Uncharacterized protein n=1 Tax=Parelaphostrongylus tenuis TaxID=148309 RepID=A0AAD5MA04_PARTN|nr:hypothetical protein KIN20_011818 [Parelaphostrongylus tenuis]